VASGLGAAAIFESSSPPRDLARPAASAAPVTLRVQSDPKGAEVYLDGVRLGVTPLLTTQEPSTADATLELRAPGRVTRSKVIRLKGEVALDLALTPASAAAEPSREHEASDRVESPPEPESSSHASGPDRAEPAGRQRRPASRSGPAHAKANADPAPPADEAPSAPHAEKASAPEESCDPPYRLDPGGVKVFKPQCF
jgi:hypothetical protein